MNPGEVQPFGGFAQQVAADAGVVLRLELREVPRKGAASQRPGDLVIAAEDQFLPQRGGFTHQGGQGRIQQPGARIVA